MATKKEQEENPNLTEKDWGKIDKARNILTIIEFVVLIGFISFMIWFVVSVMK